MTRAAIALAVATASACDGERGVTEQPSVDPVVLASASAEPTLPECPDFGPIRKAGALEHPAIVEASGIVASRRQRDVLWVHNDSGDSARVFAISSTGATLGIFDLTGAHAIDWEDLALGPGPEPDRDYLYLGDIGDNAELRDHVTVYRVVEPSIATPPAPSIAIDGAVALDFRYPDGPHDAEALLSDPATGDLVIVSKQGRRGPQFFRAAAPHDASSGESALLEEIARPALPRGRARVMMVTGGDITAAGDLVAIRTYGNAIAWRRLGGEPLAQALARPHCPLAVGPDQGGEAFGFLPDGQGYVVVSEGAGATLWRTQ